MKKVNIDPIGKLMGLRYKAHPWHGVEIGDDAPVEVTCFIEMVSIDTVKYEVDKKTGYLMINRPQKYSSILPSLYGFIPQTYCGDSLAKRANEKLKRTDIVGDKDPLDVCVLTERQISHGDLLVKAKPVGGFRMVDGDEADDKIICVLKDDSVYGEIKDLKDVPKMVIDRLKHYFLTYKQMPTIGETKKIVEIPETYGVAEAHEVIKRTMEDYQAHIETILFQK